MSVSQDNTFVLHYVYIDSFRKLKDIGFNLSNKYIIEYDKDKNTLSVEENKDYLEGFFCSGNRITDPNTNIKNLSMIIGGNKIGKTTFLHAILKYFDKEFEFSLVIYSVGDSLYYFALKKLETSGNITITYIDKSTVITKSSVYSSFLPVFYTGIFSIDEDEYNEENIVNLAYQERIRTAIRKQEDEEVIQFGKYPAKSTYDKSLNSFLKEDWHRKVKFIITYFKAHYDHNSSITSDNNSDSKSVPYIAPKYFRIAFSDYPYNYIIRLIEISKNPEEKKKDPLRGLSSIIINNIQKHEGLADAINKYYKEFSRDELLEAKWHVNAVLSALLEFGVNYGYVYAHPYFEELTKELSAYSDTYDNVITIIKMVLEKKNNNILEDIRSDLKNITISNYQVRRNFDELLNDIENSITFFRAIKSSKNTILHTTDYGYSLNFEETINRGQYIDVEELLKTVIITCYNKDYKFSYFILSSSHQEAIYTQLSSGENALLSLYSNLHWVRIDKILDNDISSPKVKRTILLLLDEIDLMLHPQWQKEFVQELVAFIQWDYKDFDVQIVMTTHSPLVLSDIPPFAAIYLSEKDGKTVISKSDNSKHTFAANIYQLLQDSFFLDGFLGCFAKNKIDSIIEEANELNSLKAKKAEINDTIREKGNNIKKAIELVGNDLIREAIKRKLNY